jgi:hypothetical protein
MMNREGVVAFVAAVLLGISTAHYGVGWQGAMLPDPTVTPGDVRAVTTAALCPVAQTSQVRNVTPAEKRYAYGVYGATKKPGVCCEVDHLVPLELGGSNDQKNLWAQPYLPTPGAHEKDVLENFLHRAVCSGAMTLRDAQDALRTDWSQAYRRMKGHAP